MARIYSGSWTSIRMPTKASTAYTKGNILMNDGTDNIDATSAAGNIRGITDETKASAANTNSIKVLIPRGKSSWFEAAVTGTFTKACEGRSYDMSNATTVNTGATTYKVVRCEKYLTSTLGVFSVNDPIS